MAKSQPAKSTAAPAKPAPVKKAAAKGHADTAPKPSAPAKAAAPAPKPAPAVKGNNHHTPHTPVKYPPVTDPFLLRQRDRLLALRDNILDSMNGVAKDTLRARAEGSEASAFGMHQADAGSDSYDRDFALSLLSQEQDALYEIEEALKRIESNSYGTCEMSGKSIAHPRLEAIPFTRYTVECQAQIEKMTKIQRSRAPVTSLFGLTDAEEGAEGEEEETQPESKE